MAEYGRSSSTRNRQTDALEGQFIYIIYIIDGGIWLRESRIEMDIAWWFVFKSVEYTIRVAFDPDDYNRQL